MFGSFPFGAGYFADYPATIAATTPTVTTTGTNAVGQRNAVGAGNVTSDGGATVTERGIVWSTSSNPTTADSKVTASGTTGAFTATLTPLSQATTYHFRAYAINSVGTSYGADTTFLTEPFHFPAFFHMNPGLV